MVNFNLDFKVFGKKTGELDGCSQAETKIRKKYKIELLELSGYWMQVLHVTERSSGSFPRVGEDDL